MYLQPQRMKISDNVPQGKIQIYFFLVICNEFSVIWIRKYFGIAKKNPKNAEAVSVLLWCILVLPVPKRVCSNDALQARWEKLSQIALYFTL